MQVSNQMPFALGVGASPMQSLLLSSLAPQQRFILPGQTMLTPQFNSAAMAGISSMANPMQANQ